jgi:hypothetical protein
MMCEPVQQLDLEISFCIERNRTEAHSAMGTTVIVEARIFLQLTLSAVIHTNFDSCILPGNSRSAVPQQCPS